MSSAEPTCHCGCGVVVTPGRRFRHGHAARLQPKWDFGEPPGCKCGCGVAVRRARGKWLQYADGHYNGARKPRHAPFNEIDDFWSWFAGFTDGEGCFTVSVSAIGGKKYLQPFFKIAVRADERPILEEICKRLGCGRVRVHVPGALTSNLQLKFEIGAVADCMRLVEVFDRYPLRAKKRRDFIIWAAAVREKALNGGGSPRLYCLREELMRGRQYNPELAKGGDANGR